MGVVLAELFQRRTGQDGAGDIGGGGARGQPGLAVDQAHFANQAAGAEHADRDRVVAAHHDVFYRHLALQQEQHVAGLAGVAFVDEGGVHGNAARGHVADHRQRLGGAELHQRGGRNQQLGGAAGRPRVLDRAHALMGFELLRCPGQLGLDAIHQVFEHARIRGETG